MEPQPKTVLALMAHPDDAEILCGGTLALLASRGWQVHIATFGNGDCGSATLGPSEIAAIRRDEARAAAALLGGTYHCLEARDTLIFYGEVMVRRANRLLRRVRPKILLAHSPQDYMPDHEQSSLIARASCFNAAIPNAPIADLPEDPGWSPDPPLAWIPHLYYADPVEGKDHFGKKFIPELIVDISQVIGQKEKVLSAHTSQREWLRAHHGIDEYIEAMRRWGADRGKAIDAAFAEGFRQHLGHAYPADDILGRVLGTAVHHMGRAGAAVEERSQTGETK